MAEEMPIWQEPQASSEQDRATIRRLVEELPEPFRKAIVLREINDLSYKEIAEVAGVPVGTVMSRLARARAMCSAQPGTPRKRRPPARDHAAACSACAEKLTSFRAMREAMAGAAR